MLTAAGAVPSLGRMQLFSLWAGWLHVHMLAEEEEKGGGGNLSLQKTEVSGGLSVE